MNTPEIGSKWNVFDVEVEVLSVAKRGRGYQVNVATTDGTAQCTYRLRDFLKAAKPL